MQGARAPPTGAVVGTALSTGPVLPDAARVDRMLHSTDVADLGGLRVASEVTHDAFILHLDGELDLAGAPRLGTAVEASQSGPGSALPLVLDLSGVSFMDSTGVRALIDAARLSRERDRPFALFRPSSAVARVLDLVDLRRTFVELEAIDAESVARAAQGP